MKKVIDRIGERYDDMLILAASPNEDASDLVGALVYEVAAIDADGNAYTLYVNDETLNIEWDVGGYPHWYPYVGDRARVMVDTGTSESGPVLFDALGVVTRIDGTRVYVRLDDGRETWNSLSLVRA